MNGDEPPVERDNQGAPTLADRSSNTIEAEEPEKQRKAGRLEQAIDELAGEIVLNSTKFEPRRGATARTRKRAAWEKWLEERGREMIAEAVEHLAPDINDWADDLEMACAREILDNVRTECASALRQNNDLEKNEERRGKSGRQKQENPARMLRQNKTADPSRKLARARIEEMASTLEITRTKEGLTKIRERLRRDGATKPWGLHIENLQWLGQIEDEKWKMLSQAPAWLIKNAINELKSHTLVRQNISEWTHALSEQATQEMGQTPTRRKEHEMNNALKQWRWSSAKPPLGVLSVLIDAGVQEIEKETEWGAALAIEQWERVRWITNREATTPREMLAEHWRERCATILEEIETAIEHKAVEAILEWRKGPMTMLEWTTSELKHQRRKEAQTGLEILQGRWSREERLKVVNPAKATLREVREEMIWLIAPTNAARTVVSAYIETGHFNQESWIPKALAVRAETPGSENITTSHLKTVHIDEETATTMRKMIRSLKKQANE